MEDATRVILKNSPISGFADEIHPMVDEQLKVLKELDIHWIEFRSGDKKGIADYTCKEAEQLKDRLDRAGVGVSALGSPIGKIGIEEDFEPHLDQFVHVCRLARILDTPRIRCFSFYIPEGEAPEKYRDEVFRRTGELVKTAAREGVMILHENEKGIYGDNAARCEELMKEFYSDAYRMTFDFANFVQCGQETPEAYALLKEYIEYLHIKDAVMGTGRVVPGGEGDGHLLEILTDLDQRGYQGYLSLEPHLADFAALSSLEKNPEKRGRTDMQAAFTTAHTALLKLLADGSCKEHK